jgi:hypothetical protein
MSSSVAFQTKFHDLQLLFDGVFDSVLKMVLAVVLDSSRRALKTQIFLLPRDLPARHSSVTKRHPPHWLQAIH